MNLDKIEIVIVGIISIDYLFRCQTVRLFSQLGKLILRKSTQTLSN